MELSPKEFEILHKNMCARFARHFKFAMYDIDDIKQEIALMILDGIQRFDASKSSLKTFIWRHVYNRLLNLRRDKLQRSDPPPVGSVEYDKWKMKEERRRIVNELKYTFDTHKDEGGDFIQEGVSSDDSVEINELHEIIDTRLTPELRRIWVAWKADEYISDDDKNKLVEHLRKVYGEPT